MKISEQVAHKDLVSGLQTTLHSHSYSKVRAHHSAIQTLNANVWTLLLFQTTDFDALGEFADNRFTAKQAGHYNIFSSVQRAEMTATLTCAIYKNRNPEGGGIETYNYNNNSIVSVSDLLYLDVGDYVEILVQCSKNVNLFGNGYTTFLTITRAL